MNKFIILIIIGITGLALLSSGQQTKITVVEVDVFSGRPNPSWTLTKEETTELSKLIDSLPTTETHNFPEPKLGFRGFILIGIKLKNHNYSINQIYFQDDIISIYNADGHRQDLHDKTKSVFNVLQVMSSTHLEPELYKAIFGN